VVGSPGLWFLSLLLLLSSCAGLPRNQELLSTRIVENVPFFPQEEFQCGPASLAGVLNYWGLNISPAEIAADIYSPGAQGTLGVDMVIYAQKKGLQASQYRGRWEDLKRNIDFNHPLIVLVDDGFWVYQRNHFMVVVGYNERGLITNSGKEQHRFISFARFFKSWERANFWTLRITLK